MTALMVIGILALTAATGDPGAAQTGGQTHAQHMAQKRGDKAMGFDQTRTSHHFRLSPKGGSIEVHVKDPADREERDRVIAHLKVIADQFAKGDFSIPVAVHAEEPAGVPLLKQYATSIKYELVADDLGGRVTISTTSAGALAGIHQFLRYQIKEHHTGDPLTVGR